MLNFIDFLGLLALFTGILFWWTGKAKAGVLRMLKDRTIISDNSKGAWTIEWGTLWLSCMGEDWRSHYPSTYVAGIGNDPAKVWWYIPKARS